jgi:poly-gamma-glutamate synthesis protein (capsule biosynthesis protein)
MILLSKIKPVVWIVFSILIGVLFASSVFAFLKNSGLQSKSEPVLNEPLIIPLVAGQSTELNTGTKYFYTNKNSKIKPKISAIAYVVGDLNTGEVILAKDQDRKLPIASTSKLMTALVAKENGDASTVATVSKKAVSAEGQNGNLRVGEKIKTSDLIYPLLLESSNDAAEALAEHFGRDNFLSKMNARALSLNMSSTSYEDPSGLSSNNKSTAADLFRLAGYLKNQKEDLLSITTKKSFSNKKHSWSNISQFLGNNSYVGGKSGFTNEAQQTVVSIFNLPLGEKGVRPIAITLLGSPDRQKDVDSILKYLKKNIYYGGPEDANTNWVVERIIAPEVKDPDFLNLVFVGDIMLDRGVRNSVVKNFNNDYSALFEKLDKENLLKKPDIAFANLEGTASDQGADLKNLYSFRMDTAVVSALKGAGFDVISMANNHVGDWGRLAFIDTLSRIKENEMLYAGGGNNALEAETPAIIEKYGMKVGFLAFSDVGPKYMEATADKAGLLLASNPRFDEIISNASKQVDYLVVSFHFGDEYKTIHNARQEYLAHRAVDNGAKIIIGHHPHVIQDTEVYKNSYIAYSLGNFIFDQAFSVNTMQGMLLNIKLNRDGTMSVRKDIVKLSKAFKPETVIKGKEEKIKFTETKPAI